MKQEAIKQNTDGLLEDIQKIGCFFRAAARMAEYEASASEKKKQFLTIDDLNGLWKQSKKDGHIDEKNNVVNSAAIANAALKILNVNGRFVEVATFQNGKMNWYKSLKADEKKADYYIQKMEQSGANKTHFVNVDKYGVLQWDPHEPAIINRHTIYTICYRFDGYDCSNEKSFVEKMNEELEDLTVKILKAEKFVKSESYKNLRSYKQDLLRLQINAMDFYALMLRRRIEAENE